MFDKGAMIRSRTLDALARVKGRGAFEGRQLGEDLVDSFRSERRILGHGAMYQLPRSDSCYLTRAAACPVTLTGGQRSASVRNS